MAKGKTATLGAGSIFEFSRDGGLNYIRVQGMTAIGSIGLMAESLETTAIDEQERTYIGGLGSPESKAFTGNYRPESSSQMEFERAAKAKETVKIKVTFPTSPLSVNFFDVALLGHQVNEPTPDAVIAFTVNGQQSGKVSTIYTTKVPVTGVTIPAAKSYSLAAAGDQFVGGTVAPANATNKSIKYFILDSSVATVDEETGQVKPIKIGVTKLFGTTDDGDFQAEQAVTVTA